MRLLVLPLLLLTFPAIAQLDVGNGTTECKSVDILPEAGTLECSSLNIDSNILNSYFDSISSPLIIKVNGPVTITHTIDISGRNGSTLSVFTGMPVMGGEGGPGAGDGGGEDGFNQLFPGLTNDSGMPDPSNGRGEAANGGNIVCGDGGGGAGFKTPGTNGLTCGGNGVGAAGGIVLFSSIIASFRGGVGGGAGGDSVASTFGAGGGGGGAIRIIAAGDITISGNIFANGGDGGDGGPDGGGGGAGSGGVIWLQSLGNIHITGSLSVNGGNGGTASSGGAGGNGGKGFIRLEDSDGIITGGGSFPDAETIAILPPLSSSSSLKSDISCGSIKPVENEHSALSQMLFGFLSVILVSNLINARRRRRRTN